MFDAFFEDREFETDDIIQAIEETVPLSKLMKDKITDLRTWAQSRARFASTVEEQASRRRDIELFH